MAKTTETRIDSLNLRRAWGAKIKPYIDALAGIFSDSIERVEDLETYRNLSGNAADASAFAASHPQMPVGATFMCLGVHSSGYSPLFWTGTAWVDYEGVVRA